MNKLSRSTQIPQSVDKQTASVINKLRADVHDELSSIDRAPIIGSTLRQELTYIKPSSSWQWWCLNQPNTTILADSFPQFAETMRNYKLRFKPESTDKSTFDSTAYSSTTTATTITMKKNTDYAVNVVEYTATFGAAKSYTVGTVLIFSTGAIAHVVKVTSPTVYTLDISIAVTSGTAREATYEELLVRALYYAQENHGSFNDWFCLTLTSAIGSVPAGDYLITGLSVANNTITIAASISAATSGSGTYTGYVEIYPYRIPSSSNARHYSIAEHNIVAAGGSEGAVVAGIMRLGYMQGLRINIPTSGYDTSGRS